MHVHAFHGDSLPRKKRECLRKTEGNLRRIKRTGPPGKKKNLSAVYEYAAGEQKYYKTICFYGQKGKDGTYLIRYPEQITVLYDAEHPRFACWERLDSCEDLELSSLR